MTEVPEKQPLASAEPVSPEASRKSTLTLLALTVVSMAVLPAFSATKRISPVLAEKVLPATLVLMAPEMLPVARLFSNAL